MPCFFIESWKLSIVSKLNLKLADFANCVCIGFLGNIYKRICIYCLSHHSDDEFCKTHKNSNQLGISGLLESSHNKKPLCAFAITMAYICRKVTVDVTGILHVEKNKAYGGSFCVKDTMRHQKYHFRCNNLWKFCIIHCYKHNELNNSCCSKLL